MSNALYNYGRQGFLDGTINWSTGDIRVILLASGYTFSQSHEFVSDLTPASYDNGRSSSLTGKSQALGVANAANASLVATAAVSSIAIVVYQRDPSGNDSASRLIAYYDTATGLPFTPAAGQTVNLNWDTGVNKIFSI